MGIFAGGGTSESAPLWAGIAALADQDAHRQLGFLNAGLCRIGHRPLYRRAFHDVTHGNNTVTLPSGKDVIGYRARPGWDPVTGLGQPERPGARAAARQGGAAGRRPGPVSGATGMGRAATGRRPAAGGRRCYVLGMRSRP